ncbi:MAG TPA: class I SAM-dependent methyltransferase, partial [Solirubrobacteraceae bacterium]|nr:class I SAM-dependent methyltransferase [Solirubrobacteraceae bacterium]
AVEYRDSRDHFENGLLRLMNLDRGAFDRWLELAERSDAADLLDRLRDGWRQLRPAPPRAPSAGPLGPGPCGIAGRVWQAAIAESPSHGVAISDELAHGWLVRWTGSEFVREIEPPVYEEEYFEGDKLRAGGYGDYTAQAGWRLEKSTRQVHEMRERTGISTGRVLDIGSGYGFFRVALGQAGYDHEGLEVSAFARSVASASYGLSTHGGTLDEHWQDWESRYDAVTLFDLIEHLEDPLRLLEQVAHVLRPGGVVGVKTPNIDCPEADIFGAYYHSLKREHLAYFSVTSLSAAAAAAGLEPSHVTTTSHLLRGFVGAEQIRRWEQSDRGADIVAWYRRPVPEDQPQVIRA